MSATCPTCNGVGSVRFGKAGSLACPQCGGSGREHTASVAEINYMFTPLLDRRRKAETV